MDSIACKYLGINDIILHNTLLLEYYYNLIVWESEPNQLFINYVLVLL